MPKTCHVAVSKPNRNSLWGLGRYHLAKQVGRLRKLPAEGFEVLGPSEVLRSFKGCPKRAT